MQRAAPPGSLSSSRETIKKSSCTAATGPASLRAEECLTAPSTSNWIGLDWKSSLLCCYFRLAGGESNSPDSTLSEGVMSPRGSSTPLLTRPFSLRPTSIGGRERTSHPDQSDRESNPCTAGITVTTARKMSQTLVLR